MPCSFPICIQRHLLLDPQPRLHLNPIVHEAGVRANWLVILLTNPVVYGADICANQSATLLTSKSRLF